MALRMNGSSSSRHGGRACAIEILPLLDNVEWQEKDGPQIEDQTVQ